MNDIHAFNNAIEMYANRALHDHLSTDSTFKTAVAAAKARWPYRARREAAVMAAMRAAAPAHKDLPMPPTGDDDAG